ncbi:MAG: transposase [Chloroflexota bacterium]
MAETSNKAINKAIAELERDPGLSPGLIRKWQQRYRIREDSEQIQASEASEAQAESRRLKRELEIARQERDILKKAIQVFSRDQKP